MSISFDSECENNIPIPSGDPVACSTARCYIHRFPLGVQRAHIPNKPTGAALNPNQNPVYYIVRIIESPGIYA